MPANREIWTALNWMDRADLEAILASVSIACYESESDSDLKRAIVDNIDDGTIEEDVVLAWESK